MEHTSQLPEKSLAWIWAGEAETDVTAKVAVMASSSTKCRKMRRISIPAASIAQSPSIT